MIRKEQGDRFVFQLETCQKLSLGLLTKGLVLTLSNTNEVFKKMREIFLIEDAAQFNTSYRYFDSQNKLLDQDLLLIYVQYSLDYAKNFVMK